MSPPGPNFVSLSGAHTTYRANLSVSGVANAVAALKDQAGKPVPGAQGEPGNRLATWVRDRVGGAWVPQSHNRHAHVSVAARQEARPPKGSAGGVMDFRDVGIIDFAGGYRYKRAC